ncbi:dihydroorotate dehydrogenase electron transfer subunit [Desulfotomaculum copahuensis]|uniref:Dihydroorotate dehydrogenase B (NAD(+)), electron transfer subunit n=1 Tax=Desulfotomaculum copahuensis TaxID=1838280 RepID=A0A1B7LJI9_9FIRM|nr:dihydroorotate dehydrogenase electron transfer subunit [Desulfotomaculum copahuensis]OAT86735.1 hypothetical protein A6M21_02655 [Desulfotomaculum copahuensis]
MVSLKSAVLAEVLENREVAAGIRLLWLDAPAVCRAAAPGQFVHVRCAENLDPLLRRPLSIHAVERGKGRMALLYQVAGRGTALLAARRPGDRLDVLGPLGHGFTIPAPGRRMALVGGGIGAAPLFFLCQELAERDVSGYILAGARSREQLIVPSLPAAGPPDEWLAPGRFVRRAATDDGSAGHHGPVTDLLAPLLAGREVDAVYACGPRGMLQAVCALLKRYRVPGQVSLEERMGCGVGACLACACRTAGEDGRPSGYQRVCVEGPVFAADAVLWEDRI